MIAKLRGVLDSKGDNWALLDVNGVFYQVFCSAKTLDYLSEIGATYTLATEMLVREDMMALYGFATAEEQDWFKVLTSVQGVGMKVGLAILSIATPNDLHIAVVEQNKAFFAQADGVGPKLAGRLVNELKDKVAKIFGATPQSVTASGGSVISFQANQSENSVFQDTASALTNLGYKPFEANQAVAIIKQEGHTGSVEDILRLCLNKLSKVS